MPWSVSDYNTNPALNTSINGTDIGEGAAAAGYNDALRQIMADIKTWTVAYAITAPVSIANGGTGQTTAVAGLAALGGLSAVYRDLIPISKSAAFTFADSERGSGMYYSGAAAAATINPEATTAITYGAAYVIYNGGTGVLTVTRGAGVSLYKNGANVNADAAIAVNGQATLIKWGANFWTINGSGVS